MAKETAEETRTFRPVSFQSTSIFLFFKNSSHVHSTYALEYPFSGKLTLEATSL